MDRILKPIDGLLNHTTMYRLVLYYVGALLVGDFALGDIQAFGQGWIFGQGLQTILREGTRIAIQSYQCGVSGRVKLLDRVRTLGSTGAGGG